MNERSVVINGKEYYRHRRGRKKPKYCLGEKYFETEEELFIAEMLEYMGIRYLHHVNFEFHIRKGKSKNIGQRVLWCPDFILDAPYRWVGETCNGSVIVGIEAKRGHIKGRPIGRSIALLKDLGIPILLVARRDIEPYYQNGKVLPLKTL